MKDARLYIVEVIGPQNIDLDATEPITFTSGQVVAIVDAVLEDANGFIEDRDKKIAELEAIIEHRDAIAWGPRVDRNKKPTS